MTPEQNIAQQNLWVVGELLLAHLDIARDQANATYEAALASNSQAARDRTLRRRLCMAGVGWSAVGGSKVTGQ